MKVSRAIVQLSLISIGLFLILATYFFYPKISENKFLKKKTAVDETIETEDKNRNLFEDVEYQGLYDFDKPIIVKSEKAYILTEKPDIVYMINMQVILHIKDEKIIIITSDKGHYNKVTYDCFFEDNVKATDDETIILAENLDLLTTEDTATAYNNVILTNDKGSLRADKLDYDFETKYYQISMFNDKNVKVKLIK